tara:strand:- start:413 stop:793 length:381 start_codon:yes stop_codon:yes gene_type:complete
MNHEFSTLFCDFIEHIKLTCKIYIIFFHNVIVPVWADLKIGKTPKKCIEYQEYIGPYKSSGATDKLYWGFEGVDKSGLFGENNYRQQFLRNDTKENEENNTELCIKEKIEYVPINYVYFKKKEKKQ